MNDSASPASVGFAGLGAMGRPMAARLAAAGLLRAVWNRTPERGRTFVREHPGVEEASDPETLARLARTIVLCVTADEDVLAVVEGLRPALTAEHLLIDCSTVAPETARRAAARVGEAGAGFVDAPISGGTEGAERGTLSVFLGGGPEECARAEPVLRHLGSRLTPVGPVGSGQAAKAVNQLMLAGVNQAVSEALAFAEAEGLDLATLVPALAHGAAGSWFLEHRSGNMIARRFPLGFRIRLHAKDLEICRRMAAAHGAQLPLAEMTLLHYRRLAEHLEEDVSALFLLKQTLFSTKR
jgi:3-hydroxyisobutyrate dehydrogenase